jgi:hypothetical protein
MGHCWCLCVKCQQVLGVNIYQYLVTPRDGPCLPLDFLREMVKGREGYRSIVIFLFIYLSTGTRYYSLPPPRIP